MSALTPTNMPYGMFARLSASIDLKFRIGPLITLFLQLYRVPCHIINLSSAQALPIIQDARQKGAPISVETTHHYLNLSSECIPPGGTYYKCSPPIREKSNQVRNREVLYMETEEAGAKGQYKTR